MTQKEKDIKIYKNKPMPKWGKKPFSLFPSPKGWNFQWLCNPNEKITKKKKPLKKNTTQNAKQQKLEKILKNKPQLKRQSSLCPFLSLPSFLPKKKKTK